MPLDLQIQLLPDLIWGMLLFCGVLNFCVGLKGPGSLAGAMPLITGAITYYAISRYSSYGRVWAFVGAVIVLFIVFMIFASRIKPKKDEEENGE